MRRINISSNAPWEDMVGYSRAVKIGNTIEVSGTVSVENGKVFGLGNPYQQTTKIIEIIANALQLGGARLEDIIRTRIYVTDIKNWEEIGKAHGNAFGEIKPASTMVEVSRLISEDYLVEIEATAVISANP